MIGNNYYDSFAEEIVAKFRRISHLIQNKSATGDYHEEILRTVLRNFLSRRFSIKTGFVYKNVQESSNQIDIMIIDEYEASAYIYQEGDFAIVRPNSVIAVLEVKTRLRGGEFDEALRNIASVKKLTDNPERICGMVFGYDSDEPKESTLDGWFKHPAAVELARTPRFGPTLFSFFKHGVLLLRLNYENRLMIDDSSNYHAILHLSKITKDSEQAKEGWQLRYILAMIYSVCSNREFHKTHMFQDNNEVKELLNYSGGVSSTNHYELGRGLVKRSGSQV